MSGVGAGCAGAGDSPNPVTGMSRGRKKGHRQNSETKGGQDAREADEDRDVAWT